MTNEDRLLLDTWKYADAQLTQWKAYEADLRARCVALIGGTKERGSETIELQGGEKATITKPTNFKIDNTDGKLYDLVAQGVSQELFDSLFKKKYEVSETVWNTLTPAQQSWLSCVVECKPGMVQLKIVAPAVEKVI